MPLFILELVFFIAFGAIVFLFVSKLPYISDVPSESPSARKNLFKAEWIDEVDRKLIDLLSKWLRKIKLLVMRLDNYVSRHIERIKNRHATNSDQQNILKEIEREEKKDEKSEETKSE
jgi:hypothetical protein